MPIVSDEARRRKSEYNKAYRTSNHARLKESQRVYRKSRKVTHPTYAADRALQNKYGITIEKREEMLAAQCHRCAICRTDTPGPKGQWHVDHCHASKQVRGMLCHACNVGLGHFKDSPDALRAAADYLEQHK